MPRSRPATTGYERLAQADDISDDSDEDPLSQSYASLQPAAAPRYAPVTQPRHRSGMASPKSFASSSQPKFRHRSGSSAGVDLKAINARLERWADEIASRFKRKGKNQQGEEERLEIHYSVFQPPEGVRPVTAESIAAPQEGVMTRAEFETIVESVRSAIRQEIHPSMISQGSSGSYFARNPDGKIVGVFKPKDEEPYAAGNPKWNKWIHRNLFPCCFGRAWYAIFVKASRVIANVSVVLFLISRMSAKQLPTYSIANYEHTSFHTQTLYGLLPNPSTIHSGIAASSIARRSLSPRSPAASRSSSRASRMPTCSFVNILGRINTGQDSVQTTVRIRRREDGRRAAVHQETPRRTTDTTATTKKLPKPRIFWVLITSYGPTT